MGSTSPVDSMAGAIRGCTRRCRECDVGWVGAANLGGEAHRIGLVEGVGGPRAAMRRSDPPYEQLLAHALSPTILCDRITTSGTGRGLSRMRKTPYYGIIPHQAWTRDLSSIASAR